MLFEYVKSHDIVKLKTYFEQENNVDVNIRDSLKNYPIHYAILARNIEIIKLLLYYNVD